MEHTYTYCPFHAESVAILVILQLDLGRFTDIPVLCGQLYQFLLSILLHQLYPFLRIHHCRGESGVCVCVCVCV